MIGAGFLQQSPSPAPTVFLDNATLRDNVVGAGLVPARPAPSGAGKLTQKVTCCAHPFSISRFSRSRAEPRLFAFAARRPQHRPSFSTDSPRESSSHPTPNNLASTTHTL